MGDTDDIQEFRELIERSSLGTPGARHLRSRTPQSQAKLAARIAEHQEKLAACREAEDHNGAAQALTELANAYLALGSNWAALDLAREATQETLAAAAELQAAAEKDAAAIRATAKTKAAALRASAEHQASELRGQAQRDLEESEAQRIQAEAEFEFQLASRRQEAERLSAVQTAAQKLVTEAEERAAKANAQADKTRSEAEQHAKLLVSNAKRNADLIIGHAKTRAEQLMSDVREELERHRGATQRKHRGATQRKLDELTAERERISLRLAQLSQLLGVPIPAQRPEPSRTASSAPSSGKGRPRRRGKRDDDWPGRGWDKVSDEQYWAELSADKLSTKRTPPWPAALPESQVTFPWKEAPVRAGEQWLLADDPAAAVKRFHRAIADGGPASVDPRIPLARALFQLGRTEEAETYIRELAAEPPRDARMCDLLAELLVEQSDLPGALAWATVGVEMCLGRAPAPVASGGGAAASPGPGEAVSVGPITPTEENELLRLLLSLRFRIRNDLGLPEDDYDRLLDSPQLRRDGGQ